MKFVVSVLLVCCMAAALSACGTTEPPPPECKGTPRAVNHLPVSAAALSCEGTTA